MIITYQGIESFKISQGDLTLALNPVSKASSAKASSYGADITLITTNHPDTNGREQTSRGDKEPFVIEGPGEYEVKDVVIKGFLSESGLLSNSGEKLLNTVYFITFEGVNICFLGALGKAELGSEVLEALDDIDLLVVPIGGEKAGVLSPAAAYKFAVSIEPKMIIPMHYDKTALEQFLKESGEGKIEAEDKLVVKKKDFDGKQAAVVVLKEE